MALVTINDGDTGSSVRTDLNNMFDEIYDNAVNVQFSADGSTSWHDDFASGVDSYWRVSRDMGSTWGDAVPIGEETTGGSSQSSQVVFEVSLDSAGSVANRISGLIEGIDYPTDWSLAVGASAYDLEITHGLSRRVAQVSVFAVDGTEEQQLFNTAAYNGIKTTDSNTLLIQSLGTILKALKVYIVMV